jgi:hypothetical protein
MEQRARHILRFESWVLVESPLSMPYALHRIYDGYVVQMLLEMGHGKGKCE